MRGPKLNSGLAKLAIFISGRGSNMQAIIKSIQSGVLKDKCECCLVFSNNPDAAGLTWAREQGVKTAFIASKGIKRAEYDQLVIDKIEKEFKPEVIILAGYMRILSPKFVRHFSGKILNIHPADTAKHQGLKAYEWAIENKLESTSITVHLVDEGVDTGAVLGKESFPIGHCKNLEELEAVGLAIEHVFYPRMIAKYLEEDFHFNQNKQERASDAGPAPSQS